VVETPTLEASRRDDGYGRTNQPGEIKGQTIIEIQQLVGREPERCQRIA